MPTAIRRTGIALGIAAVAAATFVYGQNLRLRTGQWEFTMTGLGSALSAATLSPAARAQLEQPQHYKSCVTSEDLAQLRLGPPDDEDEGCTVTSSKVTGQTADVTQTCHGDEERTEKLHVDALSAESLKATIDTTSGRGTAHLTIVGKWVGATCTDSD